MLISKIMLARFFVTVDTWQPNFIHVMFKKSESEILKRSEDFGG